MSNTRAEGVTVMVAHRFQLRRHLEISVELPDDLTDRDVERLSRWMATLPIEQVAIELPAATPTATVLPAFQHGRQCGHDGRNCPSASDHALWERVMLLKEQQP